MQTQGALAKLSPHQLTGNHLKTVKSVQEEAEAEAIGDPLPLVEIFGKNFRCTKIFAKETEK